MIKKRSARKIFVSLGIVILLILIYMNFFNFKICNDHSCFNQAVLKCNKAVFIDEENNKVWEYKVLGKRSKNCVIKVKLLMIKEGKADAIKLEGKEMKCYLGKKDIQSFMEDNKNIKPQENLENCHGILKEEIQEMMIKNLWGVIIKNIGEINKELVKVI